MQVSGTRQHRTALDCEHAERVLNQRRRIELPLRSAIRPDLLPKLTFSFFRVGLLPAVSLRLGRRATTSDRRGLRPTGCLRLHWRPLLPHPCPRPLRLPASDPFQTSAARALFPSVAALAPTPRPSDPANRGTSRFLLP